MIQSAIQNLREMIPNALLKSMYCAILRIKVVKRVCDDNIQENTASVDSIQVCILDTSASASALLEE